MDHLNKQKNTYSGKELKRLLQRHRLHLITLHTKFEAARWNRIIQWGAELDDTHYDPEINNYENTEREEQYEAMRNSLVINKDGEVTLIFMRDIAYFLKESDNIEYYTDVSFIHDHARITIDHENHTLTTNLAIVGRNLSSTHKPISTLKFFNDYNSSLKIVLQCPDAKRFASASFRGYL